MRNKIDFRSKSGLIRRNWQGVSYEHWKLFCSRKGSLKYSLVRIKDKIMEVASAWWNLRKSCSYLEVISYIANYLQVSKVNTLITFNLIRFVVGLFVFTVKRNLLSSWWWCLSHQIFLKFIWGNCIRRKFKQITSYAIPD